MTVKQSEARTMYLGKSLSAVAMVVMGWVFTAPAGAQGRQLTNDDYARAEKFMNYNVNPLVYHSVDHPTWLPDGRFWYRDRGAEGITFILVDPAKRMKAPAFDHTKLAHALSTGTGARAKVDPLQLPVADFSFSGETLLVAVDGKQLRCDLTGVGVCTPVAGGSKREGGAAKPAGPRKGSGSEISPDKTKSA